MRLAGAQVGGDWRGGRPGLRVRIPDVRRCVLPGICAALVACAAREPVFIAPELATTPIETIALAPIADARADRFSDVEVLSYVRRGVERALSRKGYAVVPISARDDGPHTAADLAPATDGELAALAPENVRYVLAVEVDQMARGTEDLGETTRTKLAARLLDAESKRVVWRDVAEGDTDLAGLLAVLRGSSSTFESAYEAARLLVSTLPDRAAEDAIVSGQPAPVDGAGTPGSLRPERMR